VNTPEPGSRRIAVISDTHMPKRGTALPRACAAELHRADLIIHAGDLSDMGTLEMVRAVGPPVVAVHGNIEEPAVREALPATAEVEVNGLRLGVVHNGGPAAGRLDRLRKRFPGMGLVVFGHSHVPLLQRADDGFAILNPGSPTDRRRQPRHSMAVVQVTGDGRFEIAFLAVDDPAGPLDPALVTS
jgi:putative phosphoesterase